MKTASPMMRRLIVLLLFLTAGLVAGLVITGRMRTAEDATASQAESAPQGRPSLGAQALPDLTGIAERAVNAVTSITSTSTIRTRLSDDPFYRFFYGDQIFERQAQSLGSGVIVSADGYVVTNNHVVEIGDTRPQVSVILADKRELPAKIVGLDPQTDLAVLKVEARNLPTIAWGDSSKLKVAEWVLAIGNPFGVFSQTVTLGIVSATGRSVEGLGSYEDFIQTDAAINRGNSGGALINARGELVGINTAIYSETGGYQGIGLAVPSNLVRSTMNELIKNGIVLRGTFLGIQLQAMTPQLAERLGAPDARGVVVTRVDTRSRAYDAGLRAGDIIVTFNGAAIEGAAQFLRMLDEAEIGSTATLAVVRDGRSVTVRVPVEQAQPTRRRNR
ncbi:MAG TPA: trypsin-like peptidase domain-containing protein [Vicinamibacterales bacterium]|nr:trypsin-like peptidase domain-containing protein [Vicinamibacterales bacterium]